MSQGLDISALVEPCCTSRLLWRRGRVSDFPPGDPGSIPGRVWSEDIFLHLLHLNVTGEEKGHGPTETRTQDLSQTVQAL